MKPERIEAAVQIVILLLIGSMAGAGSFTHVHDWTMDNAPAGTGDWLGWANAVISELTPTVAGLEMRRRKRHHQSIAYPLAVLMAAAALSLSAQVAEAKASASGWLLAALPALAFLALSKMVLSRTTPPPTPEPDAEGDTPSTSAQTSPVPAETPTAPSTTSSSAPAVPAAGPSASSTAAPALPAPDPADLPAHLITGARMAAFTHRQATGQPITTPALAEHLGIPTELAGTLIHALGETGELAEPTPTPITHVNGTPVKGRL